MELKLTTYAERAAIECNKAKDVLQVVTRLPGYKTHNYDGDHLSVVLFRDNSRLWFVDSVWVPLADSQNLTAADKHHVDLYLRQRRGEWWKTALAIATVCVAAVGSGTWAAVSSYVEKSVADRVSLATKTTIKYLEEDLGRAHARYTAAFAEANEENVRAQKEAQRRLGLIQVKAKKLDERSDTLASEVKRHENKVSANSVEIRRMENLLRGLTGDENSKTAARLKEISDYLKTDGMATLARLGSELEEMKKGQFGNLSCKQLIVGPSEGKIALSLGSDADGKGECIFFSDHGNRSIELKTDEIIMRNRKGRKIAQIGAAGKEGGGFWAFNRNGGVTAALSTLPGGGELTLANAAGGFVLNARSTARESGEIWLAGSGAQAGVRLPRDSAIVWNDVAIGEDWQSSSAGDTRTAFQIGSSKLVPGIAFMRGTIDWRGAQGGGGKDSRIAIIPQSVAAFSTNQTLGILDGGGRVAHVDFRRDGSVTLRSKGHARLFFDGVVVATKNP